MSLELLLENLLRHSLQGFTLVGTGAIFYRLSGARDPRVAYLFWRLTLGVFLLLPLLSLWGGQSRFFWLEILWVDSIVPDTVRTPALEHSAGFLVPGGWLVLFGGWLVAAIRLLRRYRAGRRLVANSRSFSGRLPISLDGIRVCVTSQIRSPAVWGWIQPTLLLPHDFSELRPEVRRLILSHELHHIRNRDWFWYMSEECLRVVFWFHPAIHWLISRIQTARELRSDLAVIETGTATKIYLEALLHFARRQPPEVLQPAFLGVLPFRERIRLIQRGVHMSSRTRLLFSVTTVAVLTAGVLAASSLFPMTGFSLFGQAAEAPLSVKELDTPPKLLKQVTPIYPDQAKQAGVEGVVLVQLTVTSLGGVADLEVVRGPVILRQSALDAVKQFEFERGTKDGKAVPVRVTVEMTFKLTEK